MSLFANNKGNYDPVTTAAIQAASHKQAVVPSTVNAGQVYKIFLPWNQAGSFNISTTYVQLAASGNSFKLIDCPSSIIMKSDIFNETVYHERTGQTFSQSFTQLSLKMNGATANANLWNQLQAFPGDVSVDGITVTIWVGHSSDIGFWDGRTQPARNSYELIVPCNNANIGSPFTINANSSTSNSLTPQRGVGTDQNTYYGWNWAQFTLKEIIFSNLDSSNNLYIVDGYGNIILSVPAGVTMRFPIPIYGLITVGSSTTDYSPFPDAPWVLGVSNPNGSSVKYLVSIVVWTNSLDYSIPTTQYV
jgi:hypothetical protein